jgi:hypothetical protein
MWNPAAFLASNHIEGQFSATCVNIETRELCAPAWFPGTNFIAADKFLKDQKPITMNGFGVPFFPHLYMTANSAGEV